MNVERKYTDKQPFRKFSITIGIESESDLHHLESALAMAIGHMKRSGHCAQTLVKYLEPIHKECHN